MNEDRPIVFTISRETPNVYKVKTKDQRGHKYNNIITTNIWFSWLCSVTRELNKEGYAVLFEVE